MTAERVVAFCRELRQRGLVVTPHHSQLAIHAMSHIDSSNIDQVRQALKCTLVSRKDDFAVFMEAFVEIWLNGETTWDMGSAAVGEASSHPSVDAAGAIISHASSDGDRRDAAAIQPGGAYSRTEILREKDFGELSPQEVEAVKGFLAQIKWRPQRWRSRRMKDGTRLERPSASRTIRNSLRHGGEALQLFGRERKTAPVSMVVLADVSGSMAKYADMILFLLHQMHHQEHFRMESFLFGTRLTRITRCLQGSNFESALRPISEQASDRSGGTRIGESLWRFNYDWARRVLRGKTIVLVISDGLERGSLELLGSEMARLQSNCHRLLWLNPLMGGKDYRPAAAGMAAALPYIDDLLPIHNFRSLEQLQTTLEALPRSRAIRRQQPYSVRQAAAA